MASLCGDRFMNGNDIEIPVRILFARHDICYINIMLLVFRWYFKWYLSKELR
jgi:hypothetical protein